MNLFQEIYGHHITLAPNRKKGEGTGLRSSDYAWVYVSSLCQLLKSCRTYKTLSKMALKDYYITPNGFYHSKTRNKSTVRWINAIVLDYDGMDILEVSNYIDYAGLPQPSFFNKTPHGVHAWWVLSNTLRAGKNGKTIKMVEYIQSVMAQDTGADPAAVGVERLVRVPHPDTVVFLNQDFKKVSIGDLLEWKDINHPPEEAYRNNINNVKLFRKGILEQPFFKGLLNGVDDGWRNHACLTLALAMKWEKYEENQTLEFLLEWNKLNNPSLCISTIRSTVRYAYRCKSKGPSTKKVLEIFGESFIYRCWVNTEAKPREERKRVHLSEWKDDLLSYLEQHDSWEGSVQALADTLKAPKRSIEEVLKLASGEGLIKVEVMGKGRTAKTSVSLIKKVKEVPEIVLATGTDDQIVFDFEQIPHSANNTFFAVVVGGRFSLPFFPSRGSPDG